MSQLDLINIKHYDNDIYLGYLSGIDDHCLDNGHNLVNVAGHDDDHDQNMNMTINSTRARATIMIMAIMTIMVMIMMMLTGVMVIIYILTIFYG